MADLKISELGDGGDFEDDDFVVIQRLGQAPFNFKIQSAKILANLEIKVIRTESDFPAAVSGVRTLENKQYMITGIVNITNQLKPPKDGDSSISSDNYFGSKLNYTGVLALFENTDFGSGTFVVNNITLSATSGTLCNITGLSSGLVYFDNVNIDGASTLGTIDTVEFEEHTVRGKSIGQGWTLNNNESVVIIGSERKAGLNEVNAVMYTFTGTHQNIQVNSNLFITNGANEAVLDIDSASIIASGIFGLSDYDTSAGGSIFVAGSLQQDEPVLKFTGNQNIPDSTVKSKMSFEDNVLETVINTINVPEKINTLWTINGISERIKFQDLCTFDNTTDTAITTFNHGMVDNDKFELVENGGLPAGLSENTDYFVLNATATTFQLETSIGGGAIDFTTDGTPDNYYRHSTGDSEEGWMIYTGIEDISLLVSGWIAIRLASGSSKLVRCRLITTDTSFVETSQAPGSMINPDNSTHQNSQLNDIVSLSTNEGVKVFVENTENTINLDCEDAFITVLIT